MLSPRFSFFSFAISLLLLSASFALQADEKSFTDKLRFSGFVGLGYAEVSANNLLGDDKDKSEIIDLGINFNYQISNNLSFSGQASYRKLGDTISDDSVRIDYAGLTFVSNGLQFGEQQYSIGRVKIKQGIYNDFRDVPVSKPTILLPQGLYLDSFRNLFLSVDGLRVNSNHLVGNGQLGIEFAVGRVNFDENFNANTLGPNVSGHWKEDVSKIVDLRYFNDSILAGFTYSSFKPSYDAVNGDVIAIQPAIPPIPVISGSLKIQSYTAFTQIDWGMLELSAEYSYRDFTVDRLVAINAGDTERPMEAYYLQAKYPLTRDIQFTLRWERYFRNANDKVGLTNQLVGLPEWSSDSITRTVGLNWQISRRWSLFTELHRIVGSGYYPPFATTTSAVIQAEATTLFATELVYRF